jgi:serine/threonine protein kinase/tetratricopeptide (TPR) repeat protein
VGLDDQEAVGLGRTLPDHGVVTEPRTTGGALRPGATIGRYVVLDQIGEGGMGVVYSAYDPELDRKVAIKLLGSGRDGRRSVTGGRRLLREAQAMARLTHPNVITVHDVGEHEQMVFVAMEFIHGHTWTDWQKAGTRTLPETLQVALGAVRGLRAAHEVGLVHRDFKPDNVMIGDDGRVRVMDFGLARVVGDDTTSRPSDGGDAPDDDPVTDPGSRPGTRPMTANGGAAVRLTRAGTVLGTPGYMAPEQFMGAETDARTDQFGFCVSLFEAVYGHRPFRGDTALAIGAAVMAGTIDVPPPSSDVPSWLRDVLLRGLSREPADRWPSLAELEDELLRHEGRRRRWWLVAAGLLPLSIGAVAMLQPDAAPSVCAGASDKLQGIWDASSKSTVEAAFARSDRPLAAEAAARTVGRLDAYANAWTSARTQACEATRVQGEQSTALMDARMRCLDGRLRSLAALAETFEQADDDVIDKAPEAAARLPAIDRCADVDYVTAPVAPPDDPQLATAIDGMRDRLASIDAMELAGRYEDGWKAVEAVETEAAQLDYPPLQAEVALRVGILGLRASHYDEAEAGFRRAFFDGRRVGDDETRARAAVFLVRTLGLFKHDHEAGLEWAEHARAEVERFGDPRLRGDLLNHMGVIHHDEGDFDRAIELHREALAVRRDALGADHPDCGHSLMELGLSLHAKGQWDEGVQRVEEAVAVLTAALGESHPIVAQVYANLASTSANSGKLTDASKYFERSSDAWVRVRGTASLDSASMLTNAAMMAHRDKAHEREGELFDRAFETYERAADPEAAGSEAWARINRAISRMDDGDPQTAVTELSSIVVELEAQESRHRPYTYTWLAIAHGRLGQHEAALAPLQRAMALHEDAGTEGPELGRTLFELGRNAFERGDPDAGRAHVLHAIESLPPAPTEGQDGWKSLRDKWGGWLADHQVG